MTATVRSRTVCASVRPSVRAWSQSCLRTRINRIRTDATHHAPVTYRVGQESDTSFNYVNIMPDKLQNITYLYQLKNNLTFAIDYSQFKFAQLFENKTAFIVIR